ncbi:single strand DNA binding protein [Pseudomonas phage LIT1]|uniref:N4 gp45-like protein n=3 Tax=Litunavirus TaxID=1920762 RepID=C8ZKS6_9CAUD|nr:single strand DNA binding protein [Pseudomonas phage LIT1]YP_009598414.1 single strand DNA binding protein [Pseudomonas phage PA26]YP_010658945.1 putative single-stranded DNA-binding protein [Pseudomonas phage VB_PaeP_VL1]YP_010659098.1 hypothetical protein PP758_gp36 [Pseudomonas phage PAP02]AFO70559.1 hypothetical protein [Pseudomonas phage PA26]QKE55107.1 hypothetical protein PAP02_036 [Pseudomonas phage PAP02]UGV19861.1 putative single-stranded DNA-binding protein [Pseudomonas phage VB
MFGNLSTSNNSDIKEAKDSIGGGSRIFDTDIYAFKILAAYGSESSGGALAVNFEFEEHGTGRKLKIQQYVTSNKEKGQTNYYVNAEGEKHYLPGFNIVNAICLMTAEKELAACAPEQRTLKIYDYDAKAEVPKQVPVLTDLTGKDIYLALEKIIENKRVKNEATGQYEDSSETRESNDVAAVFHFGTKKTLNEARAKAEPEFFDKWKEAKAGTVRDKSKKVAGGGAASGRPAPAGGQAGGGKPASLFS